MKQQCYYNKTNFLSIVFSFNIFDEQIDKQYYYLIAFIFILNLNESHLNILMFFFEELNKRKMLFEYLMHEEGGKTGGGMLRVKTEHGTHISQEFNVLNSSSP